RASRMVIRTLKAVKELRQGQVPAIAVNRAEQVTVTNPPPRRLGPVKRELPQPHGKTYGLTPGTRKRSPADGVAAVPSPRGRPRRPARSVSRPPQPPRRHRGHN